MAHQLGKPKLLADARVYLSGPMDFVASRDDEKQYGWRNRVGEFLRELGVTVFDPWFKPEVRGLHEYGREDAASTQLREAWDFSLSPRGRSARATCSSAFWPTLHMDLRMVDTSDFVIAYCPTNIYSVGTPHEIALCRQQRKPVLFISPPVDFPALHALRAYLGSRKDKKGQGLLEALANEVPIKPNPNGIPSLWYMPLVGADRFFDGFGFAEYRSAFPRWQDIRIDRQEGDHAPKRPLLRYLERLNEKLPLKWDPYQRRAVSDDEWLLWDLRRTGRGGAGASLVDVNRPARKRRAQRGG